MSIDIKELRTMDGLMTHHVRPAIWPLVTHHVEMDPRPTPMAHHMTLNHGPRTIYGGPQPQVTQHQEPRHPAMASRDTSRK